MKHHSPALLLAALLACTTSWADDAAPAAAPVPVTSADSIAAPAAAGDARPVLLDVRTREEFTAGHVPGAINIPVQELESRLGEISPLHDKPLVVYCRSGHRAGIALQLLASKGYTKISHLEGDMQGWTAAGRPVETGDAAGAHKP